MKKATSIFSIAIFILLALYFIVLHPIGILDTDDWSSIHRLRLPLPLFGAWNPIKVFPEISMSLFSYLGAYLLYPITGRYCFSISVTNGIFICLMITLYFTEFFLLISQKNKLSVSKNILLSIIFIGLHFLIVAHFTDDNVFLFYAYDMTCIYHYTLSTILNASLVMHVIRLGGFENLANQTRLNKTIIILWVYFAIFSSLYTNMILAIYVGVELLFNLINTIQNRNFQFFNFCKKHRTHIIILFLWVISLIIESTGGRSAGHESNYFISFLESIKFFLSWFKEFNIFFMIFAGITIILWFIKIQYKNWNVSGKYILAFVLTLLYVMLLSSVVNSSYVGRIDVIFAAYFWLLLILMLALNDLVASSTYSNHVLAALALVSIIGTAWASNTYKEINFCNIPYEKCEALVDDIIQQFQTAERNGDTEINLLVPAFDDDVNWPFGIYQAEHFTKAIYRHRITHNWITVNQLVPSTEMTEKYIISKE